MKIILKSTLLAFSLALGSGMTAHAQAASDQTAPPSGQQGWHHGPKGEWHKRNPEFETKMLTKRLSLTPDQASQVEPILAARDEQMKALKPAAGTQPDFKAMHSQVKAIMDDTNSKLDAVLTPAQQQELAAMHHGRGRRGNWKGQSQGAPASSL